jgi:hypothetical protein
MKKEYSIYYPKDALWFFGNDGVVTIFTRSKKDAMRFKSYYAARKANLRIDAGGFGIGTIKEIKQ